ncbi:hypothetical protein CXB51_009889 [Gossypium anomalum]|uniref:Uncharacterized protein n=1 Tax=Gossypium anomalum TaxID=47600 RepID=A0A8J5Z1H6_9ROSI|nr:hypothetical protein CXB51_009889 [Gossypium anomalum]
MFFNPSTHDHHGSRPEASDRKNSKAGTCSNDDKPISGLFMKINVDEESKVKLSDFTGLDTGYATIGKYHFPLSVHSTLKLIINVYGDVTATSE